MTRRLWPDTALIQEAYTAAGLIEVLVEDELAREGVPASLFSLLGWISLHEPVAPSMLSAETGIPPTTLRDYIHRLVARGHVRRVPNPDDGRSYLLVLTAAGRRLVDRGHPAIARAQRRVEAHLPGPAREFRRYAKELRAALRSAVDDDTPAARAVIGASKPRRERR